MPQITINPEFLPKEKVELNNQLNKDVGTVLQFNVIPGPSEDQYVFSYQVVWNDRAKSWHDGFELLKHESKGKGSGLGFKK